MKIAKNPQIVLFSATFADSVRNFATRFAPQANEIRLKQEELSLDAIKQFFMGAWGEGRRRALRRKADLPCSTDCRDEAHKYEVLVELYNLLTIGQSIIFVKVRRLLDSAAPLCPR